MLDLVIKNGRIVDGTGSPWFIGDVGIKNGQITHVGRVELESQEIIDAKRQVISPGFIDGHSHSDLLVVDNPQLDIKLQQGVTTEVVGNCGLAPAHLSKESKSYCNSTLGLLSVKRQNRGHGRVLKSIFKPWLGQTYQKMSQRTLLMELCG